MANCSSAHYGALTRGAQTTWPGAQHIMEVEVCVRASENNVFCAEKL